MSSVHFYYGWALAGQLFVIWLVLSAVSSPFIGRYLQKRREHNELTWLLERELRKQRLARNLRIADQIIEDAEAEPFHLDPPSAA